MIPFDQARKVIERYSSRLQGKRVFSTPSIPEKRVRNACNSYVSLHRDEEIMLLIDDTVFGSGKNGLTITNSRIHLLPQSGRREVFTYDEIREINYDGYREMWLNGSPFYHHNYLETGAKQVLAHLIADLVKANQEFQSHQEQHPPELRPPEDTGPPGSVPAVPAQMTPYQVLVMSMMYLILADGVIEDREIFFFRSIHNDEAALDELADVCQRTPLPQFLREVSGRLSLRQKTHILINLMDLATYSGQVGEAEDNMLQLFMDSFGIDRDMTRPIMITLQMKNDHAQLDEWAG